MLTQLFNRTKLDEMLTSCVANTQRHKRIFSVLLLDIDHFKSVNDTYGHPVGDSTLKEVALLIKQNTRSIDISGRWGGEEFLLLCNETSLQGALILAENLRQKIEQHEFQTSGHQTISIGIAQHKEGESIDNLMRRVDIALYQAKENGRNQAVTAT